MNDSAPPSPAQEIQALKAELQRSRLAYQMAMEMAQFKAGFLARAAHELRSPINSVISLHQLILADLADDPAEERDFIAQSYSAAEKMLGVLDQLIHISKAAHGTEQFHLQPLPLQSILVEVKNLTHLQAQNRNLRLSIALPRPEVYVLAEPHWFPQVLMSLVDLPIRLMQEGTIRLTTEAVSASQEIRICIEDDRPLSFWSEPLNLLHLLQTPSSHPASSTPLPSPGFSLLINQTLMELMGGKLEVLAVPSAESTVTRIQCSIPWVAGED
ncbi:MAG: HAMP domain-containing histidine kinase [Leptolyngbyaceae cyanobacterium CSU_1_4]|nr:HAMP domain-containing histidine kinase [Leptolyngbyaceae cyanobacterium CSU_1_4]